METLKTKPGAVHRTQIRVFYFLNVVIGNYFDQNGVQHGFFRLP